MYGEKARNERKGERQMRENRDREMRKREMRKLGHLSHRDGVSSRCLRLFTVFSPWLETREKHRLTHTHTHTNTHTHTGMHACINKCRISVLYSFISSM